MAAPSQHNVVLVILSKENSRNITHTAFVPELKFDPYGIIG